jgi:MarR family transcriptional regulator for hemolysin
MGRERQRHAGKVLEAEEVPPPATRPAKRVVEHARSGFLIHDVSRLRRTLFDQRLRPYGITRAQWWVLAHMSRHRGDPLSQVDLARWLDVGKVTLGGLIDRLQRSGYVQRIPGSHDRRVKHVVMTQKGQEVIAVMQQIGSELNGDIMAGISERDARLFEALLHRMKGNLLTLVKEQE